MYLAEHRVSHRACQEAKDANRDTHPIRSETPPAAVIQRANSLVEEVYEAIFAQLMALKIAPGSRITVDNLVKEFNVSHTPIREALGRLEGEGLVRQDPSDRLQRGAADHPPAFRRTVRVAPAARTATARQRPLPRWTKRSCSILAEAAGVMSRARRHGRSASLFDTSPGRTRSSMTRSWSLPRNELIRETLSHQHTHFHIFRLMFHSRVTEEALDEHEAILAAFGRLTPMPPSRRCASTSSVRATDCCRHSSEPETMSVAASIAERVGARCRRRRAGCRRTGAARRKSVETIRPGDGAVRRYARYPAG